MQPALLIALVAMSYLLLAGAASWSQPPLWALTALAAGVAPRRTFAFPPSQRPLDLALIGVIGVLVLQVIPLPAAVVHLISPHTAAVQDATRLSLANRSSAWRTLSVDAGATLQSIATMTMTVVVFWIARGVFSAGGFTRRYCRVLGWLGALAAVIALVQRAVRPGLLMGVFLPAARNATPIGPFLNRNHFAAWLLMIAGASAGYLLAHFQIHPAYRQRFRIAFKHFMTTGAMLSGVCTTITITMLLLTRSRSAAVGLGGAALAGSWLGRPRLRIERNSFPAVLSAIGVAILLMTAALDIEGWYTRFRESVGAGDFDRTMIWRESAALMKDFPIAGTGAGTYEVAMPQYQQSRIWVAAMHGWASFNNAHSHYVQALAEGGLLLALACGLAVVCAVRLALAAFAADKGELFWIRIGAGAGMLGIAIQSVWEVALLMPANAILFATLGGLVLFRREGGRPPSATQDLTR